MDGVERDLSGPATDCAEFPSWMAMTLFDVPKSIPAVRLISLLRSLGGQGVWTRRQPGLPDQVCAGRPAPDLPPCWRWAPLVAVASGRVSRVGAGAGFSAARFLREWPSRAVRILPAQVPEPQRPQSPWPASAPPRHRPVPW